MSEEEIIKNLEEFLKGPCEICKYCDGAIRNHRKAIQGLLDLYQKEKEKNKQIEVSIKTKLNFAKSAYEHFEKEELRNVALVEAGKIGILEELEELEELLEERN